MGSISVFAFIVIVECDDLIDVIVVGGVKLTHMSPLGPMGIVNLSVSDFYLISLPSRKRPENVPSFSDIVSLFKSTILYEVLAFSNEGYVINGVPQTVRSSSSNEAKLVISNLSFNID